MQMSSILLNPKLTGDIYSTSEVKTNRKWIDSKPIYRKVITANSLPNNSSTTINHGISNLETITKQEFKWYDTTDQRWFYDYRYDSTTVLVRLGGITSTAINITATGVNWSTRTSNVSITLEYTKTTD